MERNVIKLRDESDQAQPKKEMSTGSLIAITLGGLAGAALLIGGISLVAIVLMRRTKSTPSSSAKAWDQYGDMLSNPSIVDFKPRSGIHNPNY